MNQQWKECYNEDCPYIASWGEHQNARCWHEDEEYHIDCTKRKCHVEEK